MSKLLAGRYELIQKIGEGGMAVVYKAKDRLLNRYVAIKILRPEYSKDEQFVDSFKRESQAAAGLQHPNIVAIYDVGKAGSINYIVMELIDGAPLSDIIEREAPFDYKRTIDIAKQMASALSLAHKHRIIHRDVKPHNIMMTKDGIAKLTDFGIAKAVSNATLVADTNRVIGSVHYFSPEQARGAYVDERSDIYSLGIVIYEMLTGEVPFDGENPVEVALKHINEEPAPPSRIVKGIPPTLEKLVMKAIDKYPTNRYSSADELLEDLKSIEFITSKLGSAAFIDTGLHTGGSRSYTPGNTVRARNEMPENSRFTAKSQEEEEVLASLRRMEGGQSAENRKPAGKKSKKKIFAIAGGIVALLVIAAVLLYATGIRGGKEVKVPDLRGYSYSEAKTILADKGLKIAKEKEPLASDEVEKGKILSQTPAKGTKVKEGRTVRVTLSAGNEDLKLPDLTGKTYEEAKNLLSDLKLQISKGEDVDSDKVEKGKVAAQYPEAGSLVNKGDIITVNISSGAGEVLVPRLIGTKFTSEADIEKLLEDYNYVLGDVSYEESYEDPGFIIDQDPDPGSKAKKNTAINIVISKEKSTGLVPDVIGRSRAEAQSILENAGFALGKVTEEENPDQSAGLVFKQSPAIGTELGLKSTVDIWIAKTPAGTGGTDAGEGTNTGA